METPLMNQLTPSLTALVGCYSDCFRTEVFQMFCHMLRGWIVCLGRRTISRVWETTGLSQHHDHSAAFRLFSQAAWNWDEIGRLLILQILTHLVPGSHVWLVLDDTLCHKRGGHVAFGGVFLDAVLSSSKHKIYRYGNNWVTLGVVVQLPFRQDRFYCLNVLWRVFEKQGDKPRSQHKSKPQLAAQMLWRLRWWLPKRKFTVVADVAYIGRYTLKQPIDNVNVIGPLRWDAALHEPLEPTTDKRRKKGQRLPSPREILDGNDPRWPTQTIRLQSPKSEKELQVKVVRPVCWYDSSGPRELMLVLVRDPAGKWRDEALLSTDRTLTAEEVIAGYCRRWCVEVAYGDAKGFLGFHEPEVWCQNSVERAHPMAWFVGSLVVLWYTIWGQSEQTPQRHRPWYHDKPEVTFADMLATCRYHLWCSWLSDCGSQAEMEERRDWLLEYLATAA